MIKLLHTDVIKIRVLLCVLRYTQVVLRNYAFIPLGPSLTHYTIGDIDGGRWRF